LLAALAYAGAAFLFGVGLGERGEFGLVQPVFAIVIPLSAVVLAVAARRNRAFVLLTGILMLAGLLLGQREFAHAWDECLTEGQALRVRIAAFHTANEDFPSRLEDLDGDVPCGCLLRPTILHYLSNDRGFRLWMTNDKETVHFTASGRSSDRESN
jgi:hypothetical protein